MENKIDVITVKELREQLEKLEALGLGDCAVWYRDADSMDYPIEQGVWDISRGYNTVTLG